MEPKIQNQLPKNTFMGKLNTISTKGIKKYSNMVQAIERINFYPKKEKKKQTSH